MPEHLSITSAASPFIFPVFRQNGHRFISCIQCPHNYFGALCNKEPFFRLVFIQKLSLCQSGIDIQRLCIKNAVISIKFPIFVYLLAVLFFTCLSERSKKRTKWLPGTPKVSESLGTRASLSCDETDTCLPAHQPSLPISASPSKVASEIRYLFLTALLLSTPNATNVTKFDQDEITDCPVKILHSFFPFCTSQRPAKLHAHFLGPFCFSYFCWAIITEQVTLPCRRQMSQTLTRLHFDLIQRIGGNVLSSLLQIPDAAGVLCSSDHRVQSLIR